MYADLAHLVERDLAKVEVAGSSPVIRSIRRPSQAVRQRSAKPLCSSSNLDGASKNKSDFTLYKAKSFFLCYKTLGSLSIVGVKNVKKELNGAVEGTRSHYCVL